MFLGVSLAIAFGEALSLFLKKSEYRLPKLKERLAFGWFTLVVSCFVFFPGVGATKCSTFSWFSLVSSVKLNGRLTPGSI